MSQQSQNQIEPTQDYYQSFTHSVATTGGTTGVAIAANVSRRYLLIQNNDATDPAFIKIGAAAVANQGIKIVAGGSYEMSRRNGNLSTEAVNCIQGNSAEVLLITEGVNRTS
jgi:hypothetical protein